MKKYILLLRGINVSGKNRLPMQELIGILEGLSCAEIKTYIQSGNVVLKSNDSASVLQASVHDEIKNVKGYNVSVLALPVAKFKAAVKNCPFEVEEGKHLHYYFAISTPKSLDVELLESLRSKSEKYELKGPVFYLFAPEGIGRSKLAEKVEKALGVSATARNNNTINKLLELLE